MHTLQMLSHRAGARSQTSHRLLDMLSAAAVRDPSFYSAFRRAPRLLAGQIKKEETKRARTCGERIIRAHGLSDFR